MAKKTFRASKRNNKRCAAPTKETSHKKQKVATPAKKKAAQKEKPWVDELIDAKPTKLENALAKWDFKTEKLDNDVFDDLKDHQEGFKEEGGPMLSAASRKNGVLKAAKKANPKAKKQKKTKFTAAKERVARKLS